MADGGVPSASRGLLAATLINYVLGDPPGLADLASVSLVVFALLAWGADRVAHPSGIKAASMRLVATGALVSGVAVWLTSRLV